MKISKTIAGLACSTALLLGTIGAPIAHADDEAPAAPVVAAPAALAADAPAADQQLPAAQPAPKPQPKKATVTVKKAPKTVRVKKKFTVSGTMTAKGAKASLQRWTGKKWSTIAKDTTTSKGKFSFSAKLTKAGKTKLRVVTAATPKYKKAVSAKKTVKVRDTKAREAMKFALGKVGKRYVHGATGPNAFDCSGLTSYAYAKAGVKLPRNSRAQMSVGKRVSKSNLKPGDLVFFYSPVSHVAIYIGDGKVVHAGNPRTGVNVTKLKYMPFSGARRVG
ncbi:MAG: C40 family peptidase [Tessaracoccus sp.]|uniref:C40 family peptidase n=1 Tax=Tessaracoccus sp. TaxID=1971211 RepID=UPI001ECA29F7|nr:C40 family peptidase [Tessaracoccus sp.]MBK7821656.1 C40 family peptidase [Tessaracoccus sp.]